MDKELMNGVPEEEEKTVEEVSAETADEAVTAEEKTEASAEVAEGSAEEAVEEATEESSEEATEEDAETVEETTEETDSQDTEESSEDEAEEEPDEDAFCIRCGENRKCEDSEYCSLCEASLYKTKIPFLAWISGVAVLGVSLFAFVLSLLLSAPALQAARANTYAMQNRWYAAYLEYSQVSTVVDEINSILGQSTPFVRTGSGVAEKTIISYAKSRSPLDAAYMAMTMYGENVAEKLPGVKEYTDIYDEFYNNYTIMSESLDAMLTGATVDETFEAFRELENTPELNKVYYNYFLFNAADYYKLSIDERLAYVKAADEEAKAQGRDFSWLYYLEVADLLARNGRYDEAFVYLNVLAEKDKTNYRVYDLMMRCNFAQGNTEAASKILAEFKTNNEGFDTAYSLEAAYHRSTGDLEKSKLVIEEGLNENDFSSELHRQLALIYLVEGKYGEAFEEVFTADSNAAYMANYYMDSSGYTPQLDNTVYLCVNLCKMNNIATTDNALYIDQIIDYYKDFEPSEQVSKVLGGEKTAAEVIMEGVYDLA